MKKISNTAVMFDFGKDAFASLELFYDAPADSSLTVHFGEKLEDGRIDRSPGGTIRYAKSEFPVTPGRRKYSVKLVPDKRNTGTNAIALPKSFGVVMPFRYCEIENLSAALNPEDVIRTEYFYFFDDNRSEFSCSDDTLNRVWDLCKYSIKATSFCGIYVDGDRERIPYEADAYINQLSHYCVDAEYALAKRTIEYFMDHPTWPTEWLLHTAMLVYQDYYYTGDTELIERYYDKTKSQDIDGTGP